MSTIWPFDNKPFAVQEEALRRARGRDGFAHFIDPGLGKTFVATAEGENYLREGEVDHMITFCPNSLKENWVREMQKVNTGIVPEILRSGPQSYPLKSLMEESPKNFIFNYECLISSMFEKIHYIMTHSRVFLVFDESSMLKNHQAKRTKNSFILADLAVAVRVLSGTPMTQGPHDLWSQLRLIHCPNIGRYYQFRGRYCTLGGFKGKQVTGAKDEEGLHRLTGNHVFFGKKSEWAKDLPEKLYTTRAYAQEKVQRDAYADINNYLVAELESGQEISVQNLVSAMNKMQQISSGFIYDENRKPHRLVDDPNKLDKIKELKNTLELSKGKVLIFVVFRESMAMVKEALPNALVVERGMSPDDIENNKALFNTSSDPEHDYLVCQFDMGKYGHTLLGTEDRKCATIVFYENGYSLESRLQAEDRIHRWGSDRSVLYIDMVSTDVERHVVDILQRKENLISGITEFFTRGK